MAFLSVAMLALGAAPAMASSLYYQGDNCPTAVCYDRCDTFAQVDLGAPTAYLLPDQEFYKVRAKRLDVCLGRIQQKKAGPEVQKERARAC
jgi:hypothetical protein